MPTTTFVPIDLGAASGRHLGAIFDGQRLSVEEIHRFAIAPINVQGQKQWHLAGLLQHVQNGLRAAQEKYGSTIKSIGVDTWGVDFGLLGEGGKLLGNPVSYRDSRTDGIFERAFAIVPRDQIFA